MQWGGTANAGFTTETPWKRVNENYKEINVALQDQDPNSILNHFRKMTQVRKANPVLVYGDYKVLQKEHPSIYAYTRTLGDEKVLVLLNFSSEKAAIGLSGLEKFGNMLINNYPELEIEDFEVRLMPYQAVILKMEP